jgi:hypothetical protein
MEREGTPEAYKEATKVLFGGSMRISELVNMHKEEVGEDGVWVASKAHRMKTQRNIPPREMLRKELFTPEAWDIVQRRSRSTGKSGLLFPCGEFRVHQLRGLLKTAALELGWSDEERGLVLDVPHALRHGGVQEAVREGRAEELKMSTSGIDRYAKPNAARQGDKRAKKEHAIRMKALRLGGKTKSRKP